ncbi:MAG: TonB-dependent receptor plug domain-containing protein, partial [Bacteroidota bacterium]
SKSISVSSVSVSYETAEDNSNVSFVQTLSGQVSGLNITTGTGQPGSGSVVQLRGTASINGDQPLFILDGVPLSEEEFRSISAEEIESVNVLKGTNATAIYGSRGVNGVIIITTKKGAETHKDQIEALNTKINEQLTIHPWQENSSYMSFISEKKTIEQSYDAYLKIRDKYINTPTFFLDVADFFEAKGRMDYAIRIATNLIEIELDNHELIRALGYKLDQYNEYGLATYVYETVLELRPEEPQSYRDLALAYQANGQIDQAHALLSKIVNGDLLVKDEEELFYGIEQIAYVELCHLINSKGSKSLKHLTQEYSSIETDIRVVIDWNHDETDLDLYIKNPSGEVVYYSNSESKYGGRLSEDLLDGYGPESFMIKKAPKGDYEISVEYYSDRVQKITGPTSVKVTIYRNYGKANQEKEVKLFRIHENDSKVIAGTIKV